MHPNSKLLFEKYAKQLFPPGARVLEIGPDGVPSTYQRIVEDSSITWQTLDIRNDLPLTYSGCSEYSFPIASDVYDVVLSGQVLEHVPKIWIWIGELARVCKPGGLVVTINPVSWPYHEDPVDCWRVFPEGMKALYQHAALEVELCRCECLERNGRRTVPGRSAEYQDARLRIAYRVLGLLGLPVECAYDTITIGRKPAGPK
jgi:SAM-dependent methyltransferase